jgi:hypothetical protein
MSLLIAAHFLKSWNQTEHSHPNFPIDYSLRSTAMCCILRLKVLLDKSIFECSFPADSPIIMFTISTAACKMSSSAIVWVFLHFATLRVTLQNVIKALLGIIACL